MKTKSANIISSRRKPKLLTEIRQKIRAAGYSRKTIEAYVKWIKEYIIYTDVRPPEELGKENTENFLTHLAVRRNVSASTQNQTLSAIVLNAKPV
ncbi:MAG: site-specific integrase [Chlorobi bacterium]|nr:site-specific integrase [Chlorobiota bacterium]